MELLLDDLMVHTNDIETFLNKNEIDYVHDNEDGGDNTLEFYNGFKRRIRHQNWDIESKELLKLSKVIFEIYKMILKN